MPKTEGNRLRLPEIWRKVGERAHTQMDRITHSLQRKRASIRAARRGKPGRVVIVCYGNICRSPYAAAALHQRLASGGERGIHVDSAGFFGAGRPANEQAARIALHRGRDLSKHQSRLFKVSDAAAADLVLVMTHAQRSQVIAEFGVEKDRVELLGDFDIKNPPYREILDPYGKPDAAFLTVFEQIDNSFEGLCRAWGIG